MSKLSVLEELKNWVSVIDGNKSDSDFKAAVFDFMLLNFTLAEVEKAWKEYKYE